MEMNPKTKMWGEEQYLKRADALEAALDRANDLGQDEEFITQTVGNHTKFHNIHLKEGQTYKSTHGPRAWNKVPETESEKALYYGFHVHTHSNPYGLHTHVPGGQPAGGHFHSPGNKTGKHRHDIDIKEKGTYGPLSLSGDHVHKECNMPDGKHEHHPEHFG